MGRDKLTNGADCSGFVQSVFAQFGIKSAPYYMGYGAGGDACKL